MPATSGASREAPLGRDRSGDEAKKTAAVLAKEAQVSRATMERMMKLEREDPEAFEAVAAERGGAPRAQRPPPPRLGSQPRLPGPAALPGAGEGGRRPRSLLRACCHASSFSRGAAATCSACRFSWAASRSVGLLTASPSGPGR